MVAVRARKRGGEGPPGLHMAAALGQAAGMKLGDFDLTDRPAEQKLVDWLQKGNRGVCVVSAGVPEAPTPEVTLRATLIRYLALGGCDECAPPETGLQVRGAWIEGDDDRSSATKGLDFEGATLPGSLALIACRIPDRILLRSATVRSLYLNDSKISAEISGDGLQAAGGIFLRGSHVKGKVRLLGARIGGDLDCKGAKFEAEGISLACDRSQAVGNVLLNLCEFTGTAHFIGTRIEGDLSFEHAKILAKDCALAADGVQIAGALYLRDRLEIAGLLSLTGAEINTICDELACWPPRIELDRCRYEALVGVSAPTDAQSRLDWLSRIPTKPGEFWPDPYEHCAKVLREMGHGADATVILIEKERLQRKARRERVAMDLDAARRDRDAAEPMAGVRPHTDRVIGQWWHLLALRVWDGILAAVVGYGRKPQNAAIWGLGMLILGWLVFAHAAGHGAIKPNLPQVQLHPAWVDCAGAAEGQLACFLTSDSAAAYPRFNAFIYSADTLIPVVSLEMQSYWIPDDFTDRGWLVRLYLWFHIAMGWALTLLAVAGFSGLIKTDSR